MAANLYQRGRLWWWRWRPTRRFSSKRPITVRVSLRTGCRATAQRLSVQLEAWLDGVVGMKHIAIGEQDQQKLFTAMSAEAVDRIIGDRLGLPSPFHDRINMAHARVSALFAHSGRMPSWSQAWEELEKAGVPPEQILDVVVTIEVYERRAPVSDGKVVVHLQNLGLPATAENLRRGRQVGAAAMVHACLTATHQINLGQHFDLGLPLPTALAHFTNFAVERSTQTAPSEPPFNERQGVAEPTPGSPQHVTRDGRFREVADVVIERKKEDGLWDEDRAREVRASVSLFVEANGDIMFSRVCQKHLFAWTGLMGQLPRRYNHFMVAGQGGFQAALAKAGEIKAIGIEGEPAEDRKQRLSKHIGLRSGTRNKHISWLSAVVEGAGLAGFAKLNLDFKGLRHGKKEMKKTDKRRKHEKRPNWTADAFAKLTSGPVYEGCAGIDLRFRPGQQVFHDGVYWSPLVVLNICGRPGEGAGVETDDVFDDAPIPYIHVRPNSLRGLKVDEGERKVPIHPKLIELGFLDYVRAVRAAGYKALFPEFVHSGTLDFAWMMRKKAIDPAKLLHFPAGTGLGLHGKEPDGHSLRGTGRTALRDAGVEEPMRNYVSGHTQGTVGVEVYEAPPPLELVLGAIRALDPFFAHLKKRPLNLRPGDRMKFGAKSGRPPKRS